MREESHLDAMRAAIRGDFERLEARRGPEQVGTAEEPELESVAEPDAAHADEGVDVPAGSWVGRLLGRGR